MRLILGDYSDGTMTVTAICTSGLQAVQTVQEGGVDVALVDIAMPDMDGIATTRHLRALPHPPHVLMLTSLGTSGNVDRAVEAGAEGFISKTDSPEDIIRRVTGVVHGEPQFNPASQRQLINDIYLDQPASRRQEARALLDALPEREREAVLLAAQGCTNAQIAQRMFISERTAKAHLSAASERLGMGRIQMARLVERADLD
ncbi:response regulator [Bifidobacterium cuniculi]